MNEGQDFFQIGAFQIENFLINNMPFVFLDLRRDPAVPEDLSKTAWQKIFWQKAHAVSLDQVLAAARGLAPSHVMPILLLCEDAKTSMEAALKLSAAGYAHVLVTEGGLAQLQQEWTFTSDA